MSRLAIRVTRGVTLVIQAVLLMYLSWSMSITPTEVGHIGSAVHWWDTFSNDVYCVTPPLTRIVSGVPLALLESDHVGSDHSYNPYARPEWSIGRAFLDRHAPERIRFHITLARWSLIPFVLLGSYFGSLLAEELYGSSAGVIFLVLWCISPLTLGWGATLCPDMTAASLGIIAIHRYRQWLNNPTWKQTIWSGCCLGLLLLTKLTWIIAFAIWPMLWILNYFSHVKPDLQVSHSHQLKRMGIIFVIAVYIVNWGYLFQNTFRPLGDYLFVSQALTAHPGSEIREEIVPGNRFSGSRIGKIPLPFPASYLQGIDIQRSDFERGDWSYLCGVWQPRGWWIYYCYVLAIKSPLALLFLAGIAAVMSLPSRAGNRNPREDIIVILPFLTIFSLVSSQIGFSAHPRYILPALPFLYVWISKVAILLAHRSSALIFAISKTIISLLLLAATACSLWSFPHCLSYCSEAIGGARNGPKYLLGSNVDWGQDLFYLEQWCNQNSDARPLYVLYRGGFRLSDTGVEYEGRPPAMSEVASDHESIDEGWYAVSVNEIYSYDKQYAYFRLLSPVNMAGHSIYIYHVFPDSSEMLKEYCRLHHTDSNSATW